MAKIITNEIAEKNVGKYIDCYQRANGYYPMQIVKSKSSDICMIVDRNGVGMDIADEGFNATKYDYMFEMVSE